MAENYKVKSDYTALRKRSQITEKGDIFENDIMTITPLDTLFSDGQEIIYSDSNFKFSTRTDPDTKRKYNKNSWLKNPDGNENWTLGDINDAPVSDESKIRIKPNYSSLRDFAYYGSSTDMVHATINHVIMYFPGELYFSDDTFKPLDKNGYDITTMVFRSSADTEVTVFNTEDFRIIYNDLGINVETDYVNEEEVDNPNRYLTLSIQNYLMQKDGVVLEIEGTEQLTRQNFVKNLEYDGCGDGLLGYSVVGGIRIYVYIQDGETIYIYNQAFVDIEASGILVQSGDTVNYPLVAHGELTQPMTYVGVRAYGNLSQEGLNILDIPAFGKLFQTQIEATDVPIKTYGALNQNSGNNTAKTFKALTLRTLNRETGSTTNTLAGTSIRPKEEFVIEYYETIDEFEYILVNRQTNPIYKATFETPYETETGYEYTMENYTWPSRNNWNPEINTMAFNAYVMRLLKLAEYHDEFDSNNIWRMMTHEAIKNLDWTFFRENGDDVEDLSKIDSSRIEAILQLYARQYDGIKRYIDNIKYSNNITYNQKNNLPDYLLTDAVNISGFETHLPNPTGKTSVITKPLYSGLSEGYTEVDGNTNFMRNLKLNAHYINSLKGTRHGIEALLGLLGLHRDEYKITEYIGVAKGGDVCEIDVNKLNGVTDERAERDRYNCLYPSALDVEVINTNKDNISVDEDGATIYEGIACKPISVVNEEGDFEGRYVIPWYENGKTYDSGLYFQMKGGWSKKPVIDISELEIQGYRVIDFIPNGFVAGDNFYDETKNRIKFARDLQEMVSFLPNEVSNEDICYVADISALENMMGDFPLIEDEIQDESGNTVYSHYFILKDVMQSNNISSLENLGWKYIYLKDILRGTSIDGLKVLYQESIIEKTEGNNPHVTTKGYDGGSEYVEKLSKIFNYEIENNELTRFSTLDIESAITTYDFHIESGIVDNRKVDYFKPKYLSDLTEINQIEGNTYECTNTLSDVEDMIDVEDNKVICKKEFDIEAFGTLVQNNGALTNRMKLMGNFKNGVPSVLYNPEGGSEYQEPASYSLVNLKNMKIEFVDSPNVDAVSTAFVNEWQNYIRKVVVEYIKQILPSTTIFEWKFCQNYESIGIKAKGDLSQDFESIGIKATGDLKQHMEDDTLFRVGLSLDGELIQTEKEKMDMSLLMYGTLSQNDVIYKNVNLTLNADATQNEGEKTNVGVEVESSLIQDDSPTLTEIPAIGKIEQNNE